MADEKGVYGKPREVYRLLSGLRGSPASRRIVVFPDET